MIDKDPGAPWGYAFERFWQLMWQNSGQGDVLSALKTARQSMVAPLRPSSFLFRDAGLMKLSLGPQTRIECDLQGY